MWLLKGIILPLFAAVVVVTDAHAQEVNIDDWGFDVAFGSQPYMENVSRISILSPHLFGTSSHWRLSFDVLSKTLQAHSTENISEYVLSLESNSPVYKELVYTVVKFGAGVMNPGSVLYDGNIFVLPVSLGFQVITARSETMVFSYFVDYRLTAYADYESSKSLPAQPSAGIDADSFFSGALSLGLRLIF